MVKISKITINYQEQPLGITKIEQAGWVILSDHSNVIQKSYHIQLSKDHEFRTLIYDTGVVFSDQSAHISIENIEYESLTEYFLRIKITTEDGEESNWEVSKCVTAFLSTKEWKGNFITAESVQDVDKSKGTYLRKQFEIKGKVKKAYLCSTALGLYHVFLNGKKLEQDEFAPGWTSYKKHLLYQIYDVSELIEDVNVIGAMLGAGWFKGTMGFTRKRNHYGDYSAFLCQITLIYEDNRSEIIVTDGSWDAADSPVLFSEIYDGEYYDAKKEILNWCNKECTYLEWKRASTVNWGYEYLIPQSGCKVCEIDQINVKSVMITPKGEIVLDFGQNLTGWVEFTVVGKKNERVELQCFEVLDSNGNVYIENLRSAKQKVTYLCKGEGEEKYHPFFSYQGFRYVHIMEYPGEILEKNFNAYTVHSNMSVTGDFECSNVLINQLQHNILWGMKSNFLDIPMDCPQRDERLGWTGDAQIFSRTASFLMDTYLFYRKWLVDLAADQIAEGGVPHVIPDIISGKSDGDEMLEQGTHSAAAWADAAIIIPWTMYLVYGDKEILRQQYQSMKNWIDFMKKHSKNNIWNYKLQFGDWVALDAQPGSFYGATPNDLTCTAFYAQSTYLFVKILKVLEKENEALEYLNLYQNIKNTYQETFFDKEGHIISNTQTANILSLYFNLVPTDKISMVTKDLVELLDKENGHLVTGFVGTPYFCHVLSENGQTKKAYDLILQETYPSWLYQIKQGATTIWEHWDGIKEDGTMWNPDMNSFNHYAYGAVGDWLYRNVAGIDTSEENPGYKHIIIKPHIGELNYVRASYNSIYGSIKSSWIRNDDYIILSVSIPCNTYATVYFTDAKTVSSEEKIECMPTEDGYKADILSGDYTFSYQV